MSSTDLVERGGLDLTRDPAEHWNQKMLDVISRNVFRGQDITDQQLYYCLSVAESLELNPLIEEIYFLPAKSRDAKGPAWKPYVGRNGLVKKAADRKHHFEAQVVHENDRFRYTRKRDETVELTHSFTHKDRGKIVGAWAFLHDDAGVLKSVFFYAELGEYLPALDDSKMRFSPWSENNQRSAMITKCAMIGAGRERLNLGNVLADGEIDRVQQQALGQGPGSLAREAPQGGFDWSTLQASEPVIARVRAAADAMNEAVPLSWTPARLEMVLSGMSEVELMAQAARIEADLEHERARVSVSPESPAADDLTPAEGAGSAVGAEDGSDGVQDAVVVADAEHADALQARLDSLAEDLNDPLLDPGNAEVLQEEYEKVERELAAVKDPGQTSLGL